MNDVEFSVKVVIDDKVVTERITKRIDGVQGKLDAQILKDSNYYCPMDSGTLQKSAIIHSVLGSGRLVWQTPYAREQYYNDGYTHGHSRNPNATSRWFESAKARRLDVWLKLANDEYQK